MIARLFPPLLVGLLVVGCGPPEGATVATYHVLPRDFRVVIPAEGELQAVRATPIQVPRNVPGMQTIAWIAPEHRFLHAGELAVRLDDRQVNLTIEEAEGAIAAVDLKIAARRAELAGEEIELDQKIERLEKERAFEETFATLDETIFSRNEIIDAKINLEFLETQLAHYRRKKARLRKRAAAEIELLELERKTHELKLAQARQLLRHLEIHAPHDGILLYTKTWRGEKPGAGMNVWPGAEIARIPDLSEMEMKAYVLEANAGGLSVGLEAEILLEARPDTPYPATVRRVDTIAKPIEEGSPVKYFEVIVAPRQTDPRFMKPRGRGRATIFVVALEDRLVVPNQAIFTGADGGEVVFVRKSASFVERPVTIGERGLTRSVIRSGISAGEEIALTDPRVSEGGADR
ncbi:MAG: HlyD family efflux transporter periplasmic adaptor subunit [Deltaproteobacteria bacterium]|nr:MAG: HlyD family efflux transporter periplasmic adaptor subunit [Deltaproteobacteria bacterium]